MDLIYLAPHLQQAELDGGADTMFYPFFESFFSPFAVEEQHYPREDIAAGFRVNIYENNGIVYLHAEIPGVTKKDISIDLRGKHLTICGERKNQNADDKGRYIHKEISSGTVKRTFTLPFEVDHSTVSAVYENGMLKVEIPKPEQKMTSKIEIN